MDENMMAVAIRHERISTQQEGHMHPCYLPFSSVILGVTLHLYNEHVMV